jgi:hypothetical protein
MNSEPEVLFRKIQCFKRWLQWTVIFSAIAVLVLLAIPPAHLWEKILGVIAAVFLVCRICHRYRHRCPVCKEKGFWRGWLGLYRYCRIYNNPDPHKCEAFKTFECFECGEVYQRDCYILDLRRRPHFWPLGNLLEVW